MGVRPFYFLTSAFAAVEIALDFAAKLNAGRAMRSAGFGVLAHAPQEREAFLSNAHLYASRSDRLSLAAIVVLVLAICAWGCSRWRREHGLQRLLLLPLFLAVLFQLLMA